MASGATLVHSRRRRQLTLAPTLVSAIAVIVLATAAPASATGGPNSIDVGLPATAVVIDHAAHTAYVAVSDGVTNQVAIVDTSHCTSAASSHCTGDVAAVKLPGNPGPAALAFDAKSHTVYVADANTGDVSMINAATCNATKTSGCAAAPKVAALSLTAPGAIAVDISHHYDAVYVADEGASTVTVLNGKTCNATKSVGCKSGKTATVGSAPSAIAVDPAVRTVYVANLGNDSVSRLKESACSALAACKPVGKPVSIGAGTSPGALVADQGAETLFIADLGPGAISFLNTAKCNITTSSGCAKMSRAQSGLTDPEGLARVSEGRVAVADAGSDAVVVFSGATCNASKRGDCAAEVDLLGGSPVAVAAIGGTVYAADATTNSLDAIGVPRIAAKVTSKHAKTKFGWYRSPITVRFICHAGTAPLTSSCPAPVKITKNRKGQVVTGTVTSADGGSATLTLTLKLDRVKPRVKVTGVTNGKTYLTPPHLNCVAHDGFSGVASCRITRTHHGQVVHYVATAKDRAGNVATTHGKYRLS